MNVENRGGRSVSSAVGGDTRNGRMKSVVSWMVTIFLLALVVWVGWYGMSREEKVVEPPAKRLANVEVTQLQSRVYRESLTLPARVEAQKVAEVAAEFGGKLAQWHVEESAEVRAGQAVALLDTELLATQRKELTARRTAAVRSVERARAGVEAGQVGLENARKQASVKQLARDAAESDLELAEIEFGRIENLVKQGVMDRARLDTERNARTQAEIRVRQASEAVVSSELGIRSAEVQLREVNAALALAEAGVAELDAAIETIAVQLEKSVLKAPISGRLEEHLVEAGEVVTAGAAIARLYDLTMLRAVVNVPDRYVAFLDVDNPAVGEFIRLERPQAKQEVSAWLVVPGLPKLTGGEGRGVELRAQIARVGQAADPASNTFEVELQVPNPGEALKHGVIVRARIEYLTYPRAVVIPVRAVQVTDAGPRVMVVEQEGDAEVVRVRDIEPASVQGDELLVLSGLSPGERLVVSGWKGLVSGERVNVIRENGASAAGGDE